MPYPYLVVPWETDKNVWIHGSAYKDDHHEFTLNPDQAKLLLIMGLARRSDLGNFADGALNALGITLRNDGWLSFSDASNTLIQALYESLEQYRAEFLQHRPALRALNQPLLENNNVDWRLRWPSQQICFSPSAFQGSFRLNDLVVTIEMKPTKDAIFQSNQPLYADEVTSAVGRALLFMNMNPLEIGAPYVFRSAVENFCTKIFTTLGGNYPGQEPQVRNDPILLIFQILNSKKAQNMHDFEANMFTIYHSFISLQFQEELRNQFQDALDNMSTHMTWIINSLIDTVQQDFKEQFDSFWNMYVLLISDILASIIATYDDDMKDLLQGGQLNAAILNRHTQDVQNLMQKIAGRNPMDLTYEALEQRTKAMSNNFHTERFRSSLNHNNSIQGIRQHGCFDFYDYKKYGHKGGWYLYYLIDFRVYCGAGNECVLPFYAEPGQECALYSPDGYEAISAVVYTTPLEIPDRDDDESLFFRVDHGENHFKQICDEDDGDIFENLLLKPLGEGLLYLEDLLLFKQSAIVVHSGSRRAGGYVVVTCNAGKQVVGE
jgi:hypothetical protein